MTATFPVRDGWRGALSTSAMMAAMALAPAAPLALAAQQPDSLYAGDGTTVAEGAGINRGWSGRVRRPSDPPMPQ